MRLNSVPLGVPFGAFYHVLGPNRAACKKGAEKLAARLKETEGNAEYIAPHGDHWVLTPPEMQERRDLGEAALDAVKDACQAARQSSVRGTFRRMVHQARVAIHERWEALKRKMQPYPVDANGEPVSAREQPSHLALV